MEIDVSIVKREGQEYKTFTHNGTYYEIPSHESVDAAIENLTILTQIENTMALGPSNDDVYMNGTIKRQDFLVNTPEGAALVAELRQTWPEYNFNQYPINLVGKYEVHRPPYQNTSISWYNFENPSAELLADYGLTPENCTWKFHPCYGLKFDLTTNDILLKIITDQSLIAIEQRPILPRGMLAGFGRIVSQDGSLDPLVDCYIYTTNNIMKDYCDKVGIKYPLPNNDQDTSTWMWGVVYNIETLEVTHVKSYMRNHLDKVI